MERRFGSKREAAAYLSGMIDGEGHVHFHDTKPIRRVVTIVNTDVALIEACEDALDMLGVLYSRHSWKARPEGCRPAMRIYIGNPHNLTKLNNHVRLQAPTKSAALAAAVAYKGRYWQLLPREREAALIDVKRLYEQGLLSGAAIAKRYGCTPSTIEKWLREAGVEIRTRSEAQSLAHSQGRRG